jgi:hypothetical protein
MPTGKLLELLDDRARAIGRQRAARLSNRDREQMQRDQLRREGLG